MTRDPRRNGADGRHRRPTLILLAILSAVCAALPTATGACPQWKVPPAFIAIQDNRYEVSFQLKQNGVSLSGFAQYATNKRTVTGNVVQAALSGNRFGARVLWTYSGVSSIGQYYGIVDPSGYLHGNTHDAQSQKPVNVGWRSQQLMRCDQGPVEPLADRAGGDYRNFDLATASYDQCRAACSADQQCRAYTYVKPGIQGPRARCWLKNTVPPQRASDCCVSGVIRSAAPPPAVSANPALKGAARPSSGAVTRFPSNRIRPVD